MAERPRRKLLSSIFLDRILLLLVSRTKQQIEATYQRVILLAMHGLEKSNNSVWNCLMCVSFVTEQLIGVKWSKPEA